MSRERRDGRILPAGNELDLRDSETRRMRLCDVNVPQNQIDACPNSQCAWP